MTNTAIVLREAPFHSRRMIPHTLEKVTLSAINIQNEKVSRVSLSAKNPLPRLNPKNWLYHSSPAKQQKSRLLAHTVLLA